ncbi:MAG: hypothetical protein V9G20_18470 [Candidatus Promineifilaceae bacterium]
MTTTNFRKERMVRGRVSQFTIYHLPFTIFEPRINGTRMNRSGGCRGRIPPSSSFTIGD